MKKTKLIAVVLSLCMLLALVPVAALAAEFTDIDEATNENYAGAIERWSDEGVISGVGNDTFDPKGTMTRVQGFGIIANLLNLTEKADLSEYTDVPTDGWKADYLAKVVAAGIVTGYPDKTLRPEGELTREQMFVTIAKTLGVQPVETDDEEFEDIGEAADYAAPYINALHKMGAVNGSNGNVNPLDTLSREGAALLLDNLIGGYANTEGETVEIEKGKITLIVADNVAVTGEITEEDMPIVVAGQAGTVDMKEVTGDVAPTVNVTVPEVKIENAPVGTTVAAAEDVADVTVNDQNVAAGEEVVVPEPEPTPTPTIPTPPPTESVTAAAIDAIIEAGRVAVNEKMLVDNDNVPYAVIPKFTTSGTEVRNVIVTIYDGDVNIGAVKTDIMDVLVEKLQAASNQVTTVTAVKTINDTDVGEGTLGKTLTLSSNTPTDTDVYNFVKALIPDASGLGKIGGLVDKQGFTVEVDDVETGGFDTKVKYKVTFKMASLDDVIGEKIDGIGELMDYATLDWDAESHTLNVDISSNTTDINTVYQAIATPLCEAFNLVRGQLQTVQDAVNDQSGKTLDIQDAIKDTDLLDFIKGLQLVNSLDSSEKKDLTAVLATGKTSLIAALKGYQFEINVTAKSSLPTGASSGTQKYTIKFIAPALDTVIDAKIKEIDAEIDYANLTWTTDDHTLKVEITNGATQIGTVYNDIQKMLCDAFNESRNTLKTVEDALNQNEGKATLKLETALDGNALITFVKALKLQKTSSSSDTTTAGELLKQNAAISALDGYEFKINVTARGASESAVPYTISFTVQAA